MDPGTPTVLRAPPPHPAPTKDLSDTEAFGRRGCPLGLEAESGSKEAQSQKAKIKQKARATTWRERSLHPRGHAGGR